MKNNMDFFNDKCRSIFEANKLKGFWDERLAIPKKMRDTCLFTDEEIISVEKAFKGYSVSYPDHKFFILHSTGFHSSLQICRWKIQLWLFYQHLSGCQLFDPLLQPFLLLLVFLFFLPVFLLALILNCYNKCKSLFCTYVVLFYRKYE